MAKCALFGADEFFARRLCESNTEREPLDAITSSADVCNSANSLTRLKSHLRESLGLRWSGVLFPG